MHFDYTANGDNCHQDNSERAERSEPAQVTSTGAKLEHQGLSTAHNCTLPCGMFWVGGSLVRVNRFSKPYSQKGGGKRSKVTSFSRQSRRRLQQMIAKTRKDVLPMFVTLTYPDLFDENPTKWKRDLRVMAERFKRAFPKGAFVWRLELKRRKSGQSMGKVAPHFHLLVWNVDYKHLLGWFGVTWYQVVASGDEKHLAAGTRVERLRSSKGVACYVSKYLAKAADEHISGVVARGVGRWWGVIRAEYMPFVQALMVQLTEKEAVQLIRYMRRFARLRGRSFFSLACFLDADFWWDRLADLLHPG